MSRNGWLIFIAICAVLLGALYWMSRSSRVDVSGIDHLSIQSASEASGNIADHSQGNLESAVIIIEYGDFQCPGCRSAAPVMKSVVDKYRDDIGFIFRNYPLPGHPNARAAAAAAEAAGLQGKYWEMYDRLFENQLEWANLSGSTRTDMFADYADLLDLDRDKFVSDLDSERVRDKINFDAAIGREAGVTGTPTIFVNGEQVTESYKDGELVPSSTPGSNPVWSSAESFEKHVLLPALKKAGVDVKTDK